MAKEKIPDTIVHELLYFITRDTRDFVERDEILDYFQKHYAATLSLMPVLSAKPNRADVQRCASHDWPLLVFLLSYF